MFKPLFPAPAAALLICAASAYSQQTQPPAAATPQRYASSIYLKVPGEKQAALIDFYKTGAGAKAVRARMKADSKFFSWSLRQVMYPGENAPESNFVIVAATNGPPADPDPAKRDEMYRGATGMAYAQYMQTVRGMSEPGGSSLSHVHHLTDGFSLAEGDYVVAVRIKTAEGRSQEYNNLVRDRTFPMAADRVKEGQIKGWAWSHLSYPTGSSQPWDVTVTTVYKQFPLAGAGGTGGGQTARFLKLFPNANQAAYINTLRDVAKTVRTDLYRIAVAIQP